jgi:hypothetical protein
VILALSLVSCAAPSWREPVGLLVTQDEPDGYVNHWYYYDGKDHKHLTIVGPAVVPDVGGGVFIWRREGKCLEGQRQDLFVTPINSSPTFPSLDCYEMDCSPISEVAILFIGSKYMNIRTTNLNHCPDEGTKGSIDASFIKIQNDGSISSAWEGEKLEGHVASATLEREYETLPIESAYAKEAWQSRHDYRLIAERERGSWHLAIEPVANDWVAEGPTYPIQLGDENPYLKEQSPCEPLSIVQKNMPDAYDLVTSKECTELFAISPMETKLFAIGTQGALTPLATMGGMAPRQMIQVKLSAGEQAVTWDALIATCQTANRAP